MFVCDSMHPLRQWRKKAGLTLNHCAREIGTSRQVWSDWERGVKVPSRRLMMRVWKFTDGHVTANDFFLKQAEKGDGTYPL